MMAFVRRELSLGRRILVLPKFAGRSWLLVRSVGGSGGSSTSSVSSDVAGATHAGDRNMERMMVVMAE
jgi:hypothetical protein